MENEPKVEITEWLKLYNRVDRRGRMEVEAARATTTTASVNGNTLLEAPVHALDVEVCSCSSAL